jgi:hypothetical protein
LGAHWLREVMLCVLLAGVLAVSASAVSTAVAAGSTVRRLQSPAMVYGGNGGDGSVIPVP